ncbi:MAG TPA: DUF1858 domain-containing protein [Clostridiales bacterium]|nr:DUF1858 domain-containing protein [Clostridiales bacterium]
MKEKTIDFSKTVYELCSNDSEIKGILAQLGFTDITKPGMLATAGRFMTIPKGAALKKISLERIKQAFIENGYKIKE